VALNGRVEHFLAADVVSGAVSLLLSRWVAARHANLRPRFRWDRPLWRMLVSEGWAIALAGWLIALHLRVDQMLLFRIKGPTELGGYAVAVRLSEIWNMLSTVFMVSVFPLLSRFAVDEGERMKRTSTLAYRYLYLLICPIALGLGYYAAPLISLLFGPTFADAAPLLGLLAVAEVFFFSHSVSYNVFFAMNRQREAALIAGLSLVANTLLNLAWIPAGGAMGAAAASVVSYASVPLLAFLFPALRWTAVTSLSTLVPPAAATLGAGLVLFSLRPEPIVGGVVIALVYPALLWVLGGFGKADVDLARRALAGRQG
jgi:O-antigen/teichoic acid export membrane protein